MIVKVVKPFRYGTRIFEVGEKGEIVEVDNPLQWAGKPVYDFYVKFENFKPIGVMKGEVKHDRED